MYSVNYSTWLTVGFVTRVRQYIVKKCTVSVHDIGHSLGRHYTGAVGKIPHAFGYLLYTGTAS